MKAWSLSPERQDEILNLLAQRPRLGKQLALDTGLCEQLVSVGIRELCRAGLVVRGYSLTPEGRRRARRGRGNG